MSEPATIGDRTPLLSELFHSGELSRVVGSFSPWGVEAIVVVCAQRETPTFIGHQISVLQEAWLTLVGQLGPVREGGRELGRDQPAELDTELPGLGAVHVNVRPMRASGDLIARVVYLQSAAQKTEVYRPCVDSLHRVLECSAHAAYSQWVSGETHRLVMERSAVQKAEVERAVSHMRGLDRLKSDFLATVSHELRTPLTSIIGYSEMLLRGIAGELSQEQHDCVSAIFERGEELQSLISQMLDMARIHDKGAPMISTEPRDVTTMIGRAQRTMQWSATQAEIAIVSLVPEGELPLVLADAGRVQQVLVNLLGNAIKFSPTGSRVSISAQMAPRKRPSTAQAHFGDEERDAVRICIADQGDGIGASERDKIFEAFYQVDGSATRRHGGVGLGLSIVRKLVEAHGGDVWAESEPGQGARFYFTLPVAPAG